MGFAGTETRGRVARRRRAGRRAAVGAAAVLVLFGGGAAGCDDDGKAGKDGAAGGDRGPGPRGGAALAVVDTLTVKGRAPRTGYDRARFGSPWADTDANGCGTRDDILKRDLDGVRFRGGDCTVVSGRLAPDPYTGKEVTFTRGRSRVDVDHVVALSDAWQKGARDWRPSKRIALANDPLNLLAVDAGPNRGKGDGDTATWLPSNKSYRCAYVARQVAVKKKYGLWVTGAERDAMRRVLSRCPQQKLPAGDAPTEAPGRFRAR